MKFYSKIPDNFDITVYLRYLPIVSFVNKIGGKNKIGEIGSGDYGIGPFLKKFFYGFDLAFSSQQSNYLIPIKALATKIPNKWKDKFDLVLSVDMLEHLSPADRKKAIEQMIKISKRYLFIAFPSGKNASRVDRFLDRYYQRTHSQSLSFLKEHLRYPLPKEKEVKDTIRRQLRQQNKTLIQIRQYNNTNAFLYLLLLWLGFSENKYLTRIFFSCYFIRKFLSKINFFPYRKIIFVQFKNG